MKKTITSTVFIAVFTVYALSQRFGSVAAATLASSSSASAQTAQSASAPQASGGSTPPNTAPQASGAYTNGTYTGSVESAYYGNVQVEAIIKNGSIADVQFLQHPGGRGTSIYINSRAMPLLTQEAIQVQSANVSGVSGATETSMAFRRSLSSALAQAKA